MKEGTFNMCEHLIAAFQDEETGHGNVGQLVQAHLPSRNALDSNFIRSV